jgi:hypothetical protein
VPRISRFYGIDIYIYYSDHAPPHFHALYGSWELAMAIRTGKLLHGRFPKKGLALVREWARLHVEELQRNWELARERKPLRKIAPLE